MFQTLVDLSVDEREGGYQDRTPGKQDRYIGFLEADLIDYPGDARTLYYLGYAHYDIFKHSFEANGRDGVSKDDWSRLR